MLMKIVVELSVEKTEQKEILKEVMNKFADFFDEKKLLKLNGIEIEFIKIDGED